MLHIENFADHNDTLSSRNKKHGLRFIVARVYSYTHRNLPDKRM